MYLSKPFRMRDLPPTLNYIFDKYLGIWNLLPAILSPHRYYNLVLFHTVVYSNTGFVIFTVYFSQFINMFISFWNTI